MSPNSTTTKSIMQHATAEFNGSRYQKELIQAKRQGIAEGIAIVVVFLCVVAVVACAVHYTVTYCIQSL